MDRISKEARSANMSAIRSKDTKPELYLRKLLFSRGYRYRLHSKLVPGRPDLWMKKFNTAIFVHGCFWHRHQGCKETTTPKTRTDFWNEKFSRNVKRDRMVQNELFEQKKKCLIIWECTVKKMKKSESFREEIIGEIEVFLHNDSLFLEL